MGFLSHKMFEKVGIFGSLTVNIMQQQTTMALKLKKEFKKRIFMIKKKTVEKLKS